MRSSHHRKSLDSLAVAALCCVVAAGSAVGQTNPDTARYKLRPVEVRVLRGVTTDLRTPAAVTAVGRLDIQQAQPTIGLDEALAVVPGVVINNRYNFSLGTRIAVRGLGARAAFGVRGVKLMLDGIPLTVADGQANVNNLDLGSAGRIEVLRGPASSLYGNAAGGVISVQTEEPPSAKFGGVVRTVVGDVGRDQLDRMMKHQLKLGGSTGGLDYLVSGSRLETDGFRAHSRAEQTNLNARVRFNTELARWSVLVNHADAPVAQNPGSLPRDSADQRPTIGWPANVRQGTGESARQTQAGIAYEQGGERSFFNASVYGLTRSLENPLPTVYVLLDRKAGGARTTFSRSLAVFERETNLTIGGDLELQQDERDEFNNAAGQQGTTRLRDQSDRVFSIGPFAQLEAELSEVLQLTVGARYDWVRFRVEDHFTTDRDDSGERTLAAFSPRVAALYALSEDATLYASLSTAFQTPTTTELINSPPPEGQTTSPSGFNPDLEPQRALNLELGMKGNLNERLRYEAAVYQMTVQDALISYQLASVPGRDFFRNSGETRSRGLELAFGAQLASALGIELAYTFTDIEFIDDGLPTSDFEGNKVPGVPPHHLFARARLRPHSRVTLEVENEYTDRFFANDANTATNRSSNIVDARALFDLRMGGASVQPFIAMNNVFDERYNSSVVINAFGNRYFEPAPGRNMYLGAAVSFGGW